MGNTVTKRRKFKIDSFNPKRGVWHLSTEFDGHRIARLYIGRTQKEAMSDFNAHLQELVRADKGSLD